MNINIFAKTAEDVSDIVDNGAGDIIIAPAWLFDKLIEMADFRGNLSLRYMSGYEISLINTNKDEDIHHFRSLSKEDRIKYLENLIDKQEFVERMIESSCRIVDMNWSR